MKTKIHPEYQIRKVTCACGATYEIGTTRANLTNVDICSACHPFFTGTQKLLDTEGRVERFRKRYSKKAPSSETKPAKTSRTKKRVSSVLADLQAIRKPNP